MSARLPVRFPLLRAARPLQDPPHPVFADVGPVFIDVSKTRNRHHPFAARHGVEIAKELPATLLLRPFDFETLATLVFAQASLEALAAAAPAALAIVALGLLPALALSLIVREREQEAA